jgi:lipoprotein-anchoring transpeptidase ErfK/SrfK
MTTELEAAFNNVQEAVDSGHRAEARSLLQEIARYNPKDERVWLWLAALSNSPQESLDYVSQAELLAPNDARVQKAKVWAQEQLRNEAKKAPPVAPQLPPEPEQPDPIANIRKKTKTRKANSRFFRFAVILMIITFILVTSFIVYEFVKETPSDHQESVPVAFKPTSRTSIPSTPLVALQDAPSDTPTSEPTHTMTPSPTATVVEPTGIPRRANMIRPKNVSSSQAGIQPTWTPTPRPTDTPTPSPTPYPTFVSNPSDTAEIVPLGLTVGEKWVDVNVTSQTLVAYEGNVPVFDSLVSTGTDRHPTVTGQFRIWLRLRSQDMDGYRLGYDYFLRNVPFVQYFYYDYSLHGTFWHSNFGNPMSHGCVNLPTPAAEWLFNWAEYGTLVNVHI